ncbi:MAG: TolC family protein [Pseudomonadota bacterium]
MISLRARLLACVLICVPGLSSAQVGSLQSAPGPSGVNGASLTLRDSIVAALQGNPDLKGFAFSLRVQEARASAAALKPPPAVAVDLENFAGTGGNKGLSSVEATFSLSQVVELGGKRGLRIDVARSERSTLDLERKAAQLDVLAEVGRRYLDVVAGQQLVELANQTSALAQQTSAAVQRRVDAAKSPEAELRRATVEFKRAQVEQRHTEHELLIARAKLAALWGATEATFGRAQADVFALPEVGDFSVLVSRLEGNPDFARFASEARLRDAEVRLAQSTRTPDIQLSLGVRRLQQTRDQALVAGFSMPLFSRAQAEPAISEARALRDQVDLESSAHLLRVRTQVLQLHQELRHSVDEARLLREELIPEMQKALDETRYAYDRGRYGYLELVDGQRAFLEVRRAQLDAAIKAQLMQIEIERLTGESLVENNQ